MNSPRVKRLQPDGSHPKKVVTLRFDDETQTDIDNLPATDLMFRLQEKYEYTTCQ